MERLRKKTLLIVTDSFLPRWDGIARFLYEVVPYLRKHFDIVIAAPRFPGEVHGFEGVTVIRFPIYKWRVGDINPAKPKRKMLKRLVQNSDIVWTQSIGTLGAFAMHYAKKYRKPLISYVHSVEWFLFSKSLKRFKDFAEFTIRKIVPYLYNRCNLIMVPFDGIMPMLEEQNINAKMEVVHLGVDLQRYHPPEAKALAKQRIGLNPNNLIIGYLGRFGREKDVPTLYKAFFKLHEENPGVTLLLVGGKLDEPFEHMEDVKVIDSVNNPVPYYQAMDIYVLPSLTETTSLTTMEAMACGLPVVVTPVGYVEKYVEHKFNGFVFPVKNDERLYLALKSLIRDPHLRKDVGRNARKTIQQKLTWEQTAEKVTDILKRF